jgi:MoaA/NifB/PqqE/SkfB family radical SAM enzyme
MNVRGYNYIAVYLTFACDNACSYCITRIDGLIERNIVLAKDWINLFNAMEISGDVPITLQGGEPTIYPEFYEIIAGIDLNKTFNLMTNLNFDPKEFIKKVPTNVFNRQAPFPSIRASYHVGQVGRDTIINKMKILTDAGYNIGLYMLDHPLWQEEINRVKDICQNIGVELRLKEYMDRSSDPAMFRYHYTQDRTVYCKNSDLIIGPDMNVYKCHYDLYSNHNPIFNIGTYDRDAIEPSWYLCTYPTRCNPCDLKIKNSRFQIWGYCAVEIINAENINN